MIPVGAQGEILHLNSILILSDCVGKRLKLEVALRYWSPVLAAKHSLVMCSYRKVAACVKWDIEDL